MGGSTARRDRLRVAAVAVAGCLLVLHCWHLHPVAAGGEPDDDAAEEFWKDFVEPTYPGSLAKLSPIQRAVFAEYAKAKKTENLLKQSGIAAGVGGGLLGLLTPLLYTRSVSKSVGASPEPALPESKTGFSGTESELPVGSAGGPKGPGFGKRLKTAMTPSAKGLTVASGVAASALLLASLGLLFASRFTGKKIKEQRRKYRSVVSKQRQELEKYRAAQHGVTEAEAAAAARAEGAARDAGTGGDPPAADGSEVTKALLGLRGVFAPAGLLTALSAGTGADSNQ